MSPIASTGPVHTLGNLQAFAATALSSCSFRRSRDERSSERSSKGYTPPKSNGNGHSAPPVTSGVTSTIEATAAIAAAAAAAMPAQDADKKGGRPAHSSLLLDQLLMQGIALYKGTGTNDAYADIVIDNRIRRTYNIRHSGFREFLTLQSMKINNDVAMSRAALDSVTDSLAANAAETPSHE